MRMAAVAGGVGSARLLAGLLRVVDPATLTVVVNTADDERIRGLHLSPDVDTVLYHLAGMADWDRGWGVEGDTFTVQDRYAALAASVEGDADVQDWIALGDADLATNMLRTRLMDAGGTLTQATDALRRALGVGCKVLPMSDHTVRTRLTTTDGEVLAFQDYFVRRRHAPEVSEVSFEGAAEAAAAPGVLEALEAADLILLGPSNPILSVAPVLAVPGIRQAIAGASGVRVAVSPIVGGRALKGPADRVLASLGHAPTAAGVAGLYEGLVDVFVCDDADRDAAPQISARGMRALVTDTVMRSATDAARLAKEILHVAP